MKLLVLPGMGDILWVFTALQSFIEKHCPGERPEVWIWDFDGRKRSLEYVERIPFVQAAGYWEHEIVNPEFNESYMKDGRTIFPDFCGFDFYLSANGVLRQGGTVDRAFQGFDIDWYFPLVQTEREQAHRKAAREKYGEYIVAHLSEFGMFTRWVKAWGLKGCARFVDDVQERTGLPVLLTGREWDRPFAEQVAERTGALNLCAETDLDEFFGLFREASGCIGWCGGNTIKATVLKVPTLILWSTYFKDARFYRNACPPDAWGRWYEAGVVEQDSPASMAEKFACILDRST